MDVEIFSENESTSMGIGPNSWYVYAEKELGLTELVDLTMNDGDYKTEYSGNWIKYSNILTEDIQIFGTEIPGNKDWNVNCPSMIAKTIQPGITEKVRLCFEIPKNINAFIFEDSIFTRNTAKQNTLFSTNQPSSTQSSSQGGGCLIATATFDSELAPQVQKLREVRDSKLLFTESGSQFMESFNQFYYSFSPIIADYERENPVFKELVKIAITPMLSTLSLMDYADTESEVLGIGISLIILNGIMYVGLPVFGIIIAKKR